MSIRPAAVESTPALEGPHGILVQVSIRVDPHQLEQLLDVLSRLRFPVNPEILHRAHPEDQQDHLAVSVVSFPAWSRQIQNLGAVLAEGGAHLLGIEIRDSFSGASLPDRSGIFSSHSWRS